MLDFITNTILYLGLITIVVLVVFLILDCVVKNGIFYYYHNIRNWIKVKNCRAKKHSLGSWKLISKTSLGEWSEARAGQQVRSMCAKFSCTYCKTVFIKDNMWDYKWVNKNDSN